MVQKATTWSTQKTAQYRSCVMTGTGLPIHRVPFILSTQADGDPDAWNQVKEQNESAVSSTCLGFALDVTNIQNEIANCNTVWDKYKNDLLTGASDPATAVPACIEELKAAGLDTVIEEAQKQVDEFFAN